MHELGAGILILTGLHPGEKHCELLMRDFNQDVLIARVLKPVGQPAPGMLLPVILQSDLVPEDVKSRLKRRFEEQQLTTFTLRRKQFFGRIEQIDYYIEPSVAGKEEPAEVLALVINCLPEPS